MLRLETVTAPQIHFKISSEVEIEVEASVYRDEWSDIRS